MSKLKVLIDTDIGDDIDDALAIALALNSPELEVIGLTTVFRNTPIRTQLVLKLLEMYDRIDIPVATGIGKPIVNEEDCSAIPVQWHEKYGQLPLNCSVHAVDFILENVAKYDDLVLMPIGPLTNIAAAIMKDPATMSKAKIVMMGGMYSTTFPEWNIVCDPEAARVVFDAGLDITMVGLDVTLSCRLNDDHLQQIRQSSMQQVSFLNELLERWMDQSKHHPILHDPLAIGYVIDSSLMETSRKELRVETRGEYTRGVTVDRVDVFWDRVKQPNITVCTSVKVDRFISLFLDRLFQT